MDSHQFYRWVGFSAACVTAAATGAVAGVVIVFAMAARKVTGR